MYCKLVLTLLYSDMNDSQSAECSLKTAMRPCTPAKTWYSSGSPLTMLCKSKYCKDFLLPSQHKLQIVILNCQSDQIKIRSRNTYHEFKPSDFQVFWQVAKCKRSYVFKMFFNAAVGYIVQRHEEMIWFHTTLLNDCFLAHSCTIFLALTCTNRLEEKTFHRLFLFHHQEVSKGQDLAWYFCFHHPFTHN